MRAPGSHTFVAMRQPGYTVCVSVCLMVQIAGLVIEAGKK